MLIIHDMLMQLAGHLNPLEILADRLKAQTDLLCFDEFFSDITDVMLLATVLKALFSRGITLIAISNIPPDQLSSHGVQRALFMHTIAMSFILIQTSIIDNKRLKTLIDISRH